MRVVSVLPSATEIVYAVGRGSDLVGRSSECDYPPEVRNLPVVMRPRTWDADRPSREIDARVRNARSRNESLYTLDLDLLRELRPDVVLTQNLCGVCSVTEEEVAHACARAGVGPKVVSLCPVNLAQVWDSVERVGAALGAGDGGRTQAETLRARIRPTAPTGRTVAVVEWLDPPILAGLWTPDMVTAAGGTAVGPAPSEPGTRTAWAELAREPPDLLIVSPCSFTVGRTMRELNEDLRLRSLVESVRSPLGVFVADEAYFSRPGPRLAFGVELIRSLLVRQRPKGPMPVETLVPRALPEVRA